MKPIFSVSKQPEITQSPTFSHVVWCSHSRTQTAREGNLHTEGRLSLQTYDTIVLHTVFQPLPITELKQILLITPGRKMIFCWIWDIWKQIALVITLSERTSHQLVHGWLKFLVSLTGKTTAKWKEGKEINKWIHMSEDSLRKPWFQSCLKNLFPLSRSGSGRCTHLIRWADNDWHRVWPICG